MLGKLIAKYCQLLSWLMAASLALMVVLVFTNVVLRYALNSGIAVSEELSRWLFVWLTFLGGIVGPGQDQLGGQQRGHGSVHGYFLWLRPGVCCLGRGDFAARVLAADHRSNEQR